MTMSKATVATCGSGYSWMRNAQGADPCKIASILLGNCTSNGVFDIPSLSPGSCYPPPSKEQANWCQCNTVAYSLTSACAVCQGGTYSNFSSWTSHCSSNMVHTGGYPNGTFNIDIPQYAFLPLDANDDFDLASAEASTLGRASSTISMSTADISTVSSTTQTTTAHAATSSVSGASSSRLSNNLVIVIAISVVATLLSSFISVFIFYRQRYRRSHPYKPLFSRRNRPLSLSLSIDSEATHDTKVVDPPPVSIWARIYSKIRLPRSLTRSNNPPISPYQRVELSESAPLSKGRSMAHLAINTSMPPSAPIGSYQPQSMPNRNQPNIGQGEHRPKPARIDAWPVMQTITRSNHGHTGSSTIPEPNTLSKDESVPPRVPEVVKNVAWDPNFRIEFTPTTTDGFPLEKRKRPPIRRDFFNPEIGASVSSFGSYSSRSVPKVENVDEDSDSVLLISRSGDNFDIVSRTSQARTVVSSAATSIDDSSRSMAGSSIPPLSPAASSGVYLDSARYSSPEARIQLFPSSVRAAGYTGLPLGKDQG